MLAAADVVPVAGLVEERDATSDDDVSGLSDKLIIASFTLTGGARLDVPMSSDARQIGLDPWKEPE